jgi:hypothetical protein
MISSRQLVLVASWLLVVAVIELCTNSDVRTLQWNALKLRLSFDGDETSLSSVLVLDSIDDTVMDDVIRMERLWADHEVERYQAAHGYAPIRKNLLSSSSLRRRR